MIQTTLSRCVAVAVIAATGHAILSTWATLAIWAAGIAGPAWPLAFAAVAVTAVGALEYMAHGTACRPKPARYVELLVVSLAVAAVAAIPAAVLVRLWTSGAHLLWWGAGLAWLPVYVRRVGHVSRFWFGGAARALAPAGLTEGRNGLV